jgi:hypothetical protein
MGREPSHMSVRCPCPVEAPPRHDIQLEMMIGITSPTIYLCRTIMTEENMTQAVLVVSARKCRTFRCNATKYQIHPTLQCRTRRCKSLQCNSTRSLCQMPATGKNPLTDQNSNQTTPPRHAQESNAIRQCPLLIHQAGVTTLLLSFLPFNS